MKKVFIYTKYERFWHWTQVGLIFLLALTGFEVHGSYQLMGYDMASHLHINAAWALLGLTMITWFWGFVTGEWRQFNPFTPSIRFMKRQIQYYTKGIFHNEEHPTHKTKYTKFNPLQRITYLGLVIFIIPFMIISGLLYMYYFSFLNDQLIHINSLSWIAYGHTLGAFFLLAFVVAHVYLTTTGYKPLSSIKAMVSGWEEMSDEEAQFAIEEGLKVRIMEQEKEIQDVPGKKKLLNKALEDIEKEMGMAHDDHIQKAIDHTHVGYFRLDINGNYVDVNKGWLEMYKCSTLKDVIGQHVSLNRPEEEKEKVEKIIKRVLSGETITNGEVTRICKNGDFGYHNFAASPVYDENGDIVGVEGFIIDTTDLKKGK